MESAPNTADTEILATLAVQWITYLAATSDGEFPAVIVAGADTFTTAHAEALADACELRGVPLTLLYRHLRDDAVGMLGGAATTAFMRSRTTTRRNRPRATSGASTLTRCRRSPRHAAAA
jgi:hypothetical protein